MKAPEDLEEGRVAALLDAACTLEDAVLPEVEEHEGELRETVGEALDALTAALRLCGVERVTD